MRRALVWTIVVGLAIVGSQVAHGLAYRFVAAQSSTVTDDLLARTGHGYESYLPLLFAVATVLIVSALATEFRWAALGRSPEPSSPVGFACAPLAIFVAQEHFERLAHDGALPLDAVTERTFVVGALLQIPFGIAGLLVARLLLGVARSLGRRIVAAPPASPSAGSFAWTAFDAPRPRRPALSLGYGTRGPPVRFAP
jgi:hypothetical protein